MNYKQRIIFANKHHATSALYHMRRVMPSVSHEGVIDRDKLNEIRRQLETWEMELVSLYQNEEERGEE